MIKNIINNTKKFFNEYWNKTVSQRLLNGAGSKFLNIQNNEELEQLLKNLKWEEYRHPAIKFPARGWKANLPSNIEAVVGVVKLNSLPSYTQVILDDRKNTGKMSAIVKLNLKNMPRTNFIVLISGPHPDKPDVEIVWTFHPGDPIKPSQVETDPQLLSKPISVKDAIDFGLEWAKIETE